MDKVGGKLKLKEWHEKIKKRIRGHKRLKVKTWVLLLILVPLLFVDATLLRLNHIRMTELRDAVMAADEADSDEGIEAGLVALKEYVFSNIIVNVVEENGEQRVTFGTGPFYLEHQYLRAARAALEKAEQDTTGDANPNGNIYALAGLPVRLWRFRTGGLGIT